MRATRLAIVFALLSTTSVRANEGILWHRDLESAKRTAAQSNRPILVHFWSPSCAPCVRLEQEVYSRPEVKRALESMFVLARLNVDDYPATASNFGVKSWPADVILAPNGQFITVLTCPSVASEYLARLGPFAAGAPQIAGEKPLRSDLPHGAMNGSLVPAAATAIVQTGGQGPAAAMSPAAAVVPSNASGARDLVERYDFRSMAAAGDRAAVQPPQAQHEPSPQGQFVAQQSGIAPYQQSQTQRYDLVPALAAPPIGLEGYCPIQLAKPADKRQAKWVKGDPRYGVVHRGRTYLFSGPVEQQEFLRDPDRYSPVMGGADPVLFFDEGRQVAGDRSFGRFIGDRVYLFASEPSLAKFLAENDESRRFSRPNRYTEAIYQAENPSRQMLR